MAKELRFRDPDKKNPAEIQLSQLFSRPQPSHKITIHLEWEDGSWGTKVPVVVVTSE